MELREKIAKILVSNWCPDKLSRAECKRPEPCEYCAAQQIDSLYRDHYASQTPEGLLLTDDEMKAVNPDIPACSQKVFSCSECSGNCIAIAQAQLAKLQPYIEAERERVREEERERVRKDRAPKDDALEAQLSIGCSSDREGESTQ